jgi:chromosome segregation ATPase
MRSPAVALALAALVLLAAGCSGKKMQAAREAGQVKAYELELERVERDLDSQSRVLDKLAKSMREQMDELEVLEQRTHTPSPPTPTEMQQAQRQLTALEEQLEQAQARQVELQTEARRLLRTQN